MRKTKAVPAMDIGEVARLSGLPASALRFYEEKGLIRSTGRHGLRRLFDSRTPERLAFIALGRGSGFSLRDIYAMLGPDGDFRIDRKRLHAKAEELERAIKQMAAVRNLLEHVARCPARNQFDCPKFQRLLALAGRSQHRARHRRKPARSG